MTNKIRMIGNSSITEIAMLIIICCMCATTMSLKDSGAWDAVSITASLTGGLIVVALLIWATYVMLSGRTLKPMPRKPKLIVDCVSGALFVYWLFVSFS